MKIPVTMRSDNEGKGVPLCTAEPHELDAIVDAVNRWGFANKRGQLYGSVIGQFSAQHDEASFEIVACEDE